MAKQELPAKFYALPNETNLAKLECTHEQNGILLAGFILHKLGVENPYLGCMVSILEGEDAGNKFLANVGKPQRFLEPLTIELQSAIEDTLE